MEITLSIQSPDRQNHKCLALGFFCDEKPPRGICGLLDWRMNGFISREIKRGHLSGKWMEKVAIPWPDRLDTELLILLGMGNLADLSYNRIYDAAYEIAAIADKIKIAEFAFELPGDGRFLLSRPPAAQAMFTGFFDYFSQDVNKLTDARVCLMTSSDALNDVACGIKQFDKNVRHMGSVDFSALEPYFAAN